MEKWLNENSKKVTKKLQINKITIINKKIMNKVKFKLKKNLKKWV